MKRKKNLLVFNNGKKGPKLEIHETEHVLVFEDSSLLQNIIDVDYNSEFQHSTKITNNFYGDVTICTKC